MLFIFFLMTNRNHIIVDESPKCFCFKSLSTGKTVVQRRFSAHRQHWPISIDVSRTSGRRRVERMSTLRVPGTRSTRRFLCFIL